MKWKKTKDAMEGTVNQPDPDSGDDALFEALNKSKKRKRRRRIRILIIVVLLLAAALYVGMRMLQNRVRTQFASSPEEILSAKAERGSISTLVSGSGMLVNVDTKEVSVPSGVVVTEILVEYGDTVKEGDLLATLDMASVRSAMSSLQEQIEALDKDIASAKGDTVSSSITAAVTGRVKAVYAQKGDLVADVMVDSGSLAILSLDGYMEAQIETKALSKGDAVTVVLSDGSEKTGKVETVVGNRATVLVTDDGPKLDEKVTILDDSRTVLGTANLSIHNSMAITGYTGTISGVSIQENQKVYAYSTLFTLSNTSTTANYDALLRTRSEYEETLLELLKLQRNNALVAPISGSVYSVADLDKSSDEEVLDIVTLSPDVQMKVSIKVDESDILSLKLNQRADVTVSSVGDGVLEGKVTEIDKTYSSGYYTAVVTLDKVQGMIPGMTASVDVRIEGVDDAILIPADALHQTSSGYYVYTSYDEETQEYGGRVDVIPGLSNSRYVEIKSGLSEGDVVYYTQAQTFTFPFGGFGGMSGGGNGTPNFGGMGSGGTSGGGGMPNFGGGMPGGSSQGGNSRPSGAGGFSGMPGGSSQGGGGRPSSSGGSGGMPGFGG